MFVYDITKYETFEKIEENIKNVIDYKDKISYILIGNKSDCTEDEREVSYNEGALLAEKFKIEFFETSAKTGEILKRTAMLW